MNAPSPRSAACARVAFALDYPSLEQARVGAALVAPEVGVLKVGLELFIQAGPAAVKMAATTGCDVFLDLKLCDIPDTVARAVTAAAALGVRYLTVHASGGPRMLEAASEAARRASAPLTILAVTVLTSLDADDLRAVGVAAAPRDQALAMAELAWGAGVRGMVTSTEEVARLRSALGAEATLVVPGIRPASAAVGDQKRVGTPSAAISGGASLLVVGRPIRDAASPALAARAIVEEVAGQL